MSNRKAQLSNPNAELALLGSVLRASPQERVQIAQAVRGEWFADAGHSLAWQVLSDLVMRGNPVDPALLEDSLIAQGAPPATAKKMTAALAEAMPTSGLWKPLSERLQGYYLRRAGKAACQAAEAMFESLDSLPQEALAAAEAALFSLHGTGDGHGMRHISASLDTALKSLEESMKNRGHVTGGLPTGITDLDRIYLKGMRPGHVIVVGAPPGKGKTVFLMKIMWSLASGTGDYNEYEKYHQAVPVGIFSLEMDDYQLAERLLLTRSRLILNKMQTGMMNRDEQEKLVRAAQEITRSQLHIEYCPGESIQTLRIKARYAVARYGLKAIGIDYAQLITSLNRQTAGNRTAQMQEVSMGIDLMAAECGVPIIVLAQPKQESWGRRAALSDFGETSQLAKDADLALMIGQWNDKLLKTSSDTGEDDDDDMADDEREVSPDVYVDVVKNRHGPDTIDKPPIRLMWEKHFFHFVSKNNRLFDSTGKQNQHNA